MGTLFIIVFIIISFGAGIITGMLLQMMEYRYLAQKNRELYRKPNFNNVTK